MGRPFNLIKVNIKSMELCFKMEFRFVVVVLSLLRYTLGEEDYIYWEDDPYGDPNRKRRPDPTWDAYVKALGGYDKVPGSLPLLGSLPVTESPSQQSQDVFLQSVNTQNQNSQGQWVQPANMQFQQGQNLQGGGNVQRGGQLAPQQQQQQQYPNRNVNQQLQFAQNGGPQNPNRGGPFNSNQGGRPGNGYVPKPQIKLTTTKSSIVWLGGRPFDISNNNPRPLDLPSKAEKGTKFKTHDEYNAEEEERKNKYYEKENIPSWQLPPKRNPMLLDMVADPYKNEDMVRMGAWENVPKDYFKDKLGHVDHDFQFMDLNPKPPPDNNFKLKPKPHPDKNFKKFNPKHPPRHFPPKLAEPEPYPDFPEKHNQPNTIQFEDPPSSIQKNGKYWFLDNSSKALTNHLPFSSVLLIVLAIIFIMTTV